MGDRRQLVLTNDLAASDLLQMISLISETPFGQPLPIQKRLKDYFYRIFVDQSAVELIIIAAGSTRETLNWRTSLCRKFEFRL
jgi:hypothetical protein